MPLHFEIILDRRCGQGGFRQLIAFLRTAKALADFFTEVLEHGAPPKDSRGSAKHLSAIGAWVLVVIGR